MSRRWIVWPSAAVVMLSGLLLGGALRPALAEELSERVEKLEAQLEEMRKEPGFTIGGFRFLPYGYIKVDAVYDDSRAFNGDFIAWVLQETDNPTDLRFQSKPDNDEFSLTANQTRLDLKVIAPKYGEVETYGLVEVDFYGNLINRSGISELGGPENRPSILVRHAFVEMKRGTWGLLLGQTHDPISYQVADTWNYFVCWLAGNPGYRRPQIRITKDIPLPGGSKIALWGGVMRTIEDLKFTRSGEQVGWPTTFARVAYHRPMLGKEFLLAAGGHYGHEEVQSSPSTQVGPTTRSREISSWSGNLELIVPMPYGLWFKGEAFIARTFGSYFAGIGQSFNPLTLKGIRTYGGWGQLGWVASEKLRLHLGATVDNPFNEDLITDGTNPDRFSANRSLNRAFYGNFMYNLTPALIVGYEISQWLTLYSDGNGNGTDLRHQFSAMYKF